MWMTSTAQRVRMPDDAPDEAEKRRAAKNRYDTAAAGSKAEGVSGMEAGSVRACGVGRQWDVVAGFNPGVNQL